MVNNNEMKTFDNLRKELLPYGLTCEKWKACKMDKFDRHNEIEINFFLHGTCTYLFLDKEVTPPEGHLAIFWGLIPHKIIRYDTDTEYYVCTIPLEIFLGWNIPQKLTQALFYGEVCCDSSVERSRYDQFLLEQWFADISKRHYEPMMTEMKARLLRFCEEYDMIGEKLQGEEHYTTSESNLISQLCIYIAQNFRNDIHNVDIAKAVGVHPDHANVVFKRAFGVTLHEHIINERIAYARRMLLNTDKSISSIATLCGFNSINRFNCAFLKLTGLTPSNFRAKR